MPRRSWLERRLPFVASAVQWVREKVGTVRYVAQSFAGAVANRLTADWILSPLTSADEELRGELRTLRRRSRELARNNPFAARFLALLEENVVGPHGIRLQAKVEDAEGEQAERINRRIEQAWREWGADPMNASTDGRLSWVDLQQMAIRTVAQDGECLVRMVGGFDNDFGFALQLLDIDQLDTDLSQAARGDQPEIRMGVEVNEWGRPVAYHVFRSHPQDHLSTRSRRQRQRIPAEEIVHLYPMRRPGQSRGVPWFAPVLLDTHMLKGLQEAELVASRVSSAKGGFFTQNLDGSAGIPDPNAETSGPQRIKMSVEPGLFDTLPPGMDFKPWDPNHPNTAFEAFQKVVLRSIATGLRSSYHSLTGDLTEVSFSSIRQGALQERDVWRCLQQWLIAHLHRRVRTAWMKWAMTTGALRLPSMRPADFAAHEWQPRSWDWVDPLKDILGIAEEIKLGINSRRRAAAERGRDFDEILADLKREEQQIREAGVPLTFPGASPDALRAIAEMDGEEWARWSPDSRIGKAVSSNGNGAHADS